MFFEMKLKSGILVFLCFTWSLIRAQSVCPSRCLCFRSTVRCMFLQMDRVPKVPPETTILDLRFNKINDIPPGTFAEMKNLNTLLLNNNLIEKLVDGVFDGLSELKYLYLYKNRIESIEGNVLKSVPKLEQLFLHNNRLKRIPQGLFSYTSDLQRLRLDSNALICDCEMVWLAQELREKLSDTQAAATCEFPENLKGKSLTSINVEEFNCKKPQIVLQPRTVEATPGNTVYFNCKAEGTPDPEILWMHNNELVEIGKERRYSVLEDGTLMIERTADQDMGMYECIARNSVGETKTNQVELKYSGRTAQPVIVQAPQDVQTSVGKTVELHCVATGNPKPHVTWTFNGVTISGTARARMTSEGSLAITNIQHGDRGLYRCRAENSHGFATAEARVSVHVVPSFIREPEDTSVTEGTTISFQCMADGDPTPVIRWMKDGRLLPNNGRFQIYDDGQTLRISQTERADQGRYTCRAESAVQHVEASAQLRVSPKTEITTIKPDVPLRQLPGTSRAEVGSTVVLQCSDDPRADPQTIPLHRWIKEGVTLRSGRKYVIQGSTLEIRGLVHGDSGTYECFPENTLGFSRQTITLSVYESSRIGDNFVDEAFREAYRSVNTAINETRNTLFDRSRKHTVKDLIALFRYPTAASLELARAQEIFEQTLEIIHRHVKEGHLYDVEGHEQSYQELVSPSHLALIAEMAGCMNRVSPDECSNMCFHKKYRAIDGVCNNLQNPEWGSSNTAFRRLLKPIYENGFNTPIGWNSARLYNGIHLPSPRLVSSVVISTEHVSSDEEHTHMLMQWGQFLDHDLDLTPQSVSHHRFSDGRRCNETCENEYPCFPIPVPTSDVRLQGRGCLGLARSSATCNTGTTSIFFHTFAPRQQFNAITAYIDASNVYGSTETHAQRLRDLSNERGLLLVGPESIPGKRLLPYDFNGVIGPSDCQIEHGKRYIPCFMTGDHRSNEQLALTVMHTLWVREHNRIATELLRINPHWDGDMIYHETRKIMGGMMQHITYAHWLPKIFGPVGMKMLGPYEGYDPSVDASVSNEFATAAMRFGHSLIQPVIFRLNETFQPIKEGNLELRRAFFAPYRLVEEGGIDPVLRGLFGVGTKKRQPNEIMNSELTEHLFELANAVGQDLASLNIQRARDHGIPFYNQYRKLCNLTEAKDSFEDFKNEIKDKETRDKLALLYGHPGNVDLFPGAMAETPLENAKIGPTLMCILVDQFKRLRAGDRFWYENPMTFTSDQIVQIKQVSLASVICDSSDRINRVQPDVFRRAHLMEEYVPCDKIPRLDLKMWSDCCMDCKKAGDFRSITSHFQKSNDYSFQSDDPSHKHEQQHRVKRIQDLTDHVYNKQEVELKMMTVEQRIEGMEGIVESLQHTVKALNRKMRNMYSHMGMGNSDCMDESGNKKSNGETWFKEECTECFCKKGNVKCKTITCPALSCESPKKVPGLCCQMC
ncbi:hypothetical protein ACJMK2_042223 [Sinanodonta woodiana]|uniref:Peroxidase n=1 Tax=Sinanodonta woodiana TaxID=1069815 RepID=A0ABD3W6N3_SINWO